MASQHCCSLKPQPKHDLFGYSGLWLGCAKDYAAELLKCPAPVPHTYGLSAHYQHYQRWSRDDRLMVKPQGTSPVVMDIHKFGDWMHLANISDQPFQLGCHTLRQYVAGCLINEFPFPARFQLEPFAEVYVWCACSGLGVWVPSGYFVADSVHRWNNGPDCTTILCDHYGLAIAWMSTHHCKKGTLQVVYEPVSQPLDLTPLVITQDQMDHLAANTHEVPKRRPGDLFRLGPRPMLLCLDEGVPAPNANVKKEDAEEPACKLPEMKAARKSPDVNASPKLPETKLPSVTTESNLPDGRRMSNSQKQPDQKHPNFENQPDCDEQPGNQAEPQGEECDLPMVLDTTVHGYYYREPIECFPFAGAPAQRVGGAALRCFPRYRAPPQRSCFVMQPAQPCLKMWRTGSSC